MGANGVLPQNLHHTKSPPGHASAERAAQSSMLGARHGVPQLTHATVLLHRPPRGPIDPISCGEGSYFSST